MTPYPACSRQHALPRWVHRLDLPAVLLLLSLTGCGGSPSEKQLLANHTLAQAKESLQRGDARGARQFLFQALSLDRDLGRAEQTGEEQKLLGDLYAGAAAYDSAIAFYSAAGESYRSIADRASARAMTLAIAGVYRWTGQERRAFDLYTEAYRLAQVFGDSDGARDIQWDMLPAARALHERDQEDHILTDLRTAYTASGDVPHQAEAYFQTGVTCAHRHQDSLAILSFLQVRNLADQLRDSALSVRSLGQLAICYFAAGQPNDALRAYTAGLLQVDRMRGGQPFRLDMLTRVGNYYLRARRYADALRFYHAALNSALATGDKIAEGYLFVQMGHCTMGTGGAPLKEFNTALELFRRLAYPPGTCYALFSLGLASLHGNHPAEAVQFLKDAVDLGDAWLWKPPPDGLEADCRQALEASNGSSPDGALIELLLQLGRRDEAFWYVERRNERELFRVLNAGKPATQHADVNAQLEELFHLKALRVGAERRYADLLSTASDQFAEFPEVHDVVAQTARLYDDLAARIAAAQPPLRPAVEISSTGLPEVQKLLPEGSALLVTVPTRRSLFLFAITAGRVSLRVAAVGREDLESDARSFTDLLRQRLALGDSTGRAVSSLERQIRNTGGRLYEEFIRPVERDIGDAATVYFVPIPSFPSVPFHALRSGSSSRSPYVAERWLVSYLPSAQTLALPRQKPQPVNQVVALGFPGSSGWDVEYELRDIRAFYKDARLYFDRQATFATLQHEHADVLHLAVECHYDSASPGNSTIIFSDGQPDPSRAPVGFDSLLSLPPYPTVVVSALEVGRVAVHSSLPCLLLADGSQTVIINAYTPSRKAKKYFGEIFYTALLGGASSPAAFRKAQLEMINSEGYATPSMWAPFFLWGL